MSLALVLLAALLPVYFLYNFIQRQDSAQPEPKKMLRRGMWYGVLSAVIVLVFHEIIPDSHALYPQYSGSVFGAMLMALYDAAIPEEAAKLLMLWLLIRKNPYFDEHLDGIVYATCVGLGFAGLENIFYLASNYDNLMSVAFSRALFAVPGHFFFAVVMGYFVSLACFSSVNRNQRLLYMALAYLAPVALHAIYDGILMVSDVAHMGGGILFVAFLIFCVWLRKKGIAKIAALKEKDSVGFIDLF